MKRSQGVHLFICMALGLASGIFVTLAIENTSIIAKIIYGVCATIFIVAAGLNNACGSDES